MAHLRQKPEKSSLIQTHIFIVIRAAFPEKLPTMKIKHPISQC